MRTSTKILASSLPVIAAVALAAVLPAATALGATTTVTAQAGGGYITTYTADDGDVLQVYAATPMALSVGAPVAEQVTQPDGTTVTQYSVDFSANVPAAILSSSAASKPQTSFSITPYDELLALGVDSTDAAAFQAESGGGTQINVVCVNYSGDSGKVKVHGCDVTRKVGSSGSIWYLTDATHATAILHDSGCIVSCDHLTGLKMGTRYGSGNIIQTWKPGGDVTTGSCYTYTASLTYKGVGVSVSGALCPNKIGVYDLNNTHYSTKWSGNARGDTDPSRGTEQVDGVYNGSSASPYPSVYSTVWWTTCC